MIVLVISISLTTLANTKKDSTDVIVPISYIRKANLIFVDYDKTKTERDYYKKISSLVTTITVTDSTTIKALERKINNLNSIIVDKDNVCNAELKIKEKELKKSKRKLFFIGAGEAGVAVLLILLL